MTTLKNISNCEELYNFALENGLYATKKLLKQYIANGQPEDFCRGATTRAMCLVAGCALDKVLFDNIGIFGDYLDTTYGWELYADMWEIL